MTQPSFVPIAEADQVRPALSLHVPGPWFQNRPGEIKGPGAPRRPGFGMAGPDQGFALRLAHRFEGRLLLAPGESAEDVIWGIALLAGRRAALVGRAPCIYDVQVALNLFGFLVESTPDLVTERLGLFRSVAHEYDAAIRLLDAVPDATLRLTPAQIEGRAPGEWRGLLAAPGGAPPASSAPS